MTRLRVVPYRKLKRILESQGFAWVRCVGSHNTFRHEDGRTIAIPDHGKQEIVRPLLRKILRDVGLSIEEYDRLLDEL